VKSEEHCPRVRELLDGYVLGGLGPEELELVETHLAECADCRVRAEFTRSLADVVRARETEGRGYHLSTEAITRLAFGPEFLSPSVVREARDHLSRCSRCRDLVELATKGVQELGISPPQAETSPWQRILDALRMPFTKRLAPAWVGAAAVLVVLGLVYFRQREVIEPEEQRVAESPSEIGRPEPGVATPTTAGASWRALVAEAEATAARGNSVRSLALADSAWTVGSTEFDETSGNYTFTARWDSVPERIYIASYSEADSLMTRILRVKEKALGPEHPDIALALDNLAGLREREWKHRETVPLRERALAIREKTLDPLHHDLAQSVMTLAHHYNHLGRYAEAEPLYKRALDLRIQIYEPHIEDSERATKYLAQAYDNLGHLYLRQGRYTEADRSYREALEVRRAGYPPDHPSIGANLSYFGRVSWALGQLDEAEDFYRRGLELREKGLGPDHPDVAASKSSLAGVLEVQGKYREAEELYKEVLEKRRAALAREKSPPAHPGIAMGLHSLASVKAEQGMYAEAEGLYKEAIDVWQECFGFEHPRSVGTISDLAYNYMQMGRYDEAGAQYDRALDIAEEAYGEANPRIADILESTSLLARRQKKYDPALAEARPPVRIRGSVYRDNAIYLTERDALAFSHSLNRSVANYLSCFIDAGAPDNQVEDAANIILANKGPVSDEIFGRQRALLTDDDPEARALAAALRDVKFQLSQAYIAGVGRNVEAYASRVDSLESLATDLEERFARKSSSFRERREAPEATTATLASLLPPNAVLVEYLRFEYIDAVSEELIPRYVAIVLPGGGSPEFIDLGDAAVIDEYIDEYAHHMADFALRQRHPSASDEVWYERISGDIYASVWRPVEDMVASAEMVLIAPDGALNLLSFGGLKTARADYLIETVRFHYLTAGRDLVRLTGEVEHGRGLLAMGDPEYGGADEGPMMLAQRGALPACDEFRDLHFVRLPGFRTEIEAVEESWVRQSQEPATIYLGPDATEEHFKARAPGNRAIHLATHGFFLGSECGAVSRSGFGIQDRYYAGANPLILSGLALARANLTIDGGEAADREDGILTAYEVSALDLSGTGLVVLSACETALGTVEEGEGTFGLRRALHMAGARSVVSTLWKIPDQATSEMMGKLYSDLRHPLAEALQKVQIDQIRALRADGQSDHPYSWAAFMATGDWR
jgi:CHAT domain-containing protein/tetratricopeptide (TPR) repeat protein